VIHVSTGDMFRTQAAQGTAFGLEAKRYMDAGELVPDSLIMRLDKGRLSDPTGALRYPPRRPTHFEGAQA